MPLVDGNRRRKNAFVHCARFSSESDPLELGFRNKSSHSYFAPNFNFYTTSL